MKFKIIFTHLTICALFLIGLGKPIHAYQAQEYIRFSKACDAGEVYTLLFVGDLLMHSPFQKRASWTKDNYTNLWSELLFPGLLNLWIGATGRDGEDVTERVAAGVRGVTQIVGWTTFIFLFGSQSEWSPYLPYLLALCVFLGAWSGWRETQHQRKKLKENGLIRSD